MSNFIYFPAILSRIDSTVGVKFLYKYRRVKLFTINLIKLINKLINSQMTTSQLGFFIRHD